MKKWDNLKVALDYDDTFTVNPQMWGMIVAVMKQFGAEVKFVTYRSMKTNNADIELSAKEVDIPIIYCNYYQKAQVCAKSGWIPDIWIDDMPILIPMKQQLEGMLLGIEKSDNVLNLG